MDTKILRSLIRKIILETKKDVLGEPDSTSEKHRDEPQPQYDADASQDDEEDEEEMEEASLTTGVAGYIAPLGHGNGPGDKPYGKK
tara:strand:- start:1334 stop:1591 length:258 start_codon:yes stop_codon:yes gene_type:complete